MGWRARLGFLIPPGNPTIEPEIAAMALPGVTAHFSRMVAHGAVGLHEGQEERNRSQLEHLDASADLLAAVKPDVMILAHAATSYTLGRRGEAELLSRLQSKYGVPVATAFGSVVVALHALDIKRVALGTPYSEAMTLKGKALLEEHGFSVVRYRVLDNVTNIYDETPERAYRLGREIDTADAQAVYLSGVGMPTVSVIAMLEHDLGKPAISATTALFWHALRLAGIRDGVPGYGRLFETAPRATAR
jgi:maleate cis-trans isomerase